VSITLYKFKTIALLKIFLDTEAVENALPYCVPRYFSLFRNSLECLALGRMN
jgi:hypothetical protein